MINSKYETFSIFRKLCNSDIHNEDLILIYQNIKDNLESKEEKDLIKSFIKKPNINLKSLSYDRFNKYINKLNSIHYRDDTYQLKEKILCQTHDIAQVNTIERIINEKPYKASFKTLKDIRSENPLETIWKSCPHCSRKYLKDINTTYVICGYNNSGYDLKGCGKDWCFKCGKLLCKTWHVDSLYNMMNRYHDSICCHHHSKKSGYKYPDDYCQCKTNYVDRNI